MGKRQASGGGAGVGMLWGIVAGVALAVAYVKLGFVLPAWMQPADYLKEKVISLAVSVGVDQSDVGELQREIAHSMRDADLYIELDNSLDGFITEELIWRERTKRSLKLLQDLVKQMQQTAEDERFARLTPSIERVLARLPNQTESDRVLVYRYLEQRFPGQSDAAIIEQLGKLSLAELLQIQPPFARVLFRLPKPAQVRLTIFDEQSRAVRTLVEDRMPRGQFRLYWDFMDDDGDRLPEPSRYTYQLWVDGELRRDAQLESAKPIWQ